MADFPSLPLFTDAYLADTRHLTTEEHGAYLLLMMEAWRRVECSLPDDDLLLARLSGLTTERWAEVKPIVMAFWKRDGRRRTWTQKRLLKERSYVAQKSASQRDKAAKRWNTTEKNDAAALPERCPEDAPTPTPTPTPSLTSFEKGGGGGDACARVPETVTGSPPEPEPAASETEPSTNQANLRERILAACGADPVSGLTGPNGNVLGTRADMHAVERWQRDLQLPPDAIVAVVEDVMARKRDGPPSRLTFFDQPMQREAARRSAPPLTPIEGGRNAHPAVDHREAAATDALRDKLAFAGRNRGSQKPSLL